MSLVGKIVKGTIAPQNEKEDLPIHELAVIDGFMQGRNYFYLCMDLDTKELYQVHPSWMTVLVNS